MLDAWIPPRLAMGGANLGNLFEPITDEQARAVLDAAWGSGIRWFDTAPHYGLGLSERRLGAFLRDRPRHEVLLSTKVGRLLRPLRGGCPDVIGTDTANGYAVRADHERVWDFSPGGIRQSIEDSLERLGTDRIDVAFLHDPDESPDPQRALTRGLDTLDRLRAEGIVSRVGVGSKSVPTLLAAAESGACDVLMVAGRLTLLEWADELPEACLATDTTIVAAGVFNSGLLATAAPDSSAHYEYGSVPSEVLIRATELARRCHAAGTDLPTAALQYPMRHPAVRGIVLGAGDPAQLYQNVRRFGTVLPERVWTALSRVTR